MRKASKFITKRTFGIVDSKGNILLKPISDFPLEFQNNIAMIYINGYEKNGYVYTNGKLFLIKDWSSLDDFKGGLGEVISKYLHGIPMKFSEETRYYVYDETKKGKWKLNYLNNDFKYVIPLLYDSVAAYKTGQIREVMKNHKYGFLDSTATLITKIEYDDIDIKNEYA